MRKYTVTERSKYTELITFADLNSKGEKIQMEITKCSNPGGKTSLPYLWKKHGFTSQVLETWLSVDTYATENGGAGTCWGRYNPQIKLSVDGKRRVINFAWLLEDTEENRQRLIAEVARLAFGK